MELQREIRTLIEVESMYYAFDKAYKEFWKRRGMVPPSVCDTDIVDSFWGYAKRCNDRGYL